MKRFSFYILTFSSFLLASCMESKSYIRSTPYVSLPTESSRAEIAGTVSGNHIEGFSSIRIWDNLHVQGQAYWGRQGRIYDAGVSYTYQTNKGQFQLLTGFGRGVVEWSTVRGTVDHGFFDMAYPDYDIDYRKFFIQPTAMLKFSDLVRIGMSFRMNFLHFNEHLQYEEEYIPGTMYKPGYYADVEKPLDSPNARITDLGMVVKIGNNRVFGFAQLGVSLDDNISNRLIYDRPFSSMGIGVHLDRSDSRTPTSL